MKKKPKLDINKDTVADPNEAHLTDNGKLIFYCIYFNFTFSQVQGKI